MNNKDYQQTILVILVGLIAFTLYTKNLIFLKIAVSLGIGSIISKGIGMLIHKFWMSLSRILGYITPNIILAVFYFLFLTPIAIFSRILSSKRPLQLKNNPETMFKSEVKKFPPNSFTNPW